MLPEAWIDVETPYYSSRLKAKCIECPIYKLVLGNVVGARPANDPDLYWRLPATQDVAGTNASQSVRKEIKQQSIQDSSGESPTVQEALQANPVITRSQSGRQAEQQKLRVPQVSPGISREALVVEQENDPTLRSSLSNVDVERCNKNGDRHLFFTQDGLLQRIFVSE
ncbi:hypothetical protein HPB50_007691 [Hyalomma asiaticum]|uniref:Uncharacterized protein n=1 Tax=Hyalomma asiaticum TaxID=266040 RepID=A0ACB7TGL3_HYAAI|nr:hypothetical protein HPB50_007691 [Hyalomma asiaticum]